MKGKNKMTTYEKIKCWEKEVKYFARKYGKDSIEVKSAKLNLRLALEKGEKNA